MANPINSAGGADAVTQALQTQQNTQNGNLSTSIVNSVNRVSGFFTGMFSRPAPAPAASALTDAAPADSAATSSEQGAMVVYENPSDVNHTPVSRGPVTQEQRQIEGVAQEILALAAPFKGQRQYADAIRAQLQSDGQMKAEMQHIAENQGQKVYNINGTDLHFEGQGVSSTKGKDGVTASAQHGVLTVKITENNKQYTLKANLS